jgi:hypothetical protein
VKHVDNKEYTAIFPDKNSLDTFSKISEILMSIHGIKVKVLKSNVDPEAIELLHTTWVKIYGLPSIACKEGIVLKIATLAREPLLVDELSLIKTWSVRVKMNWRDPYKLRGFVRIFFNKVGYEVRFVSELYKEKPTFPPSPLTREMMKMKRMMRRGRTQMMMAPGSISDHIPNLSLERMLHHPKVWRGGGVEVTPWR